jgi:ABC-type antimicrobial peptide transport system permease subunit
LNVGAGENITYWDLRYTDDTYTTINFGQSFYENYTIKAVVKNNNKFPSDSIAGSGFENVILINLVDFNQYYKSHYSGSLSLDACFNLIITFESPQSYYNTKDIPGTIVKIRKVGEQIINTLGFYNQEYGQNTLYYIDMPRVGILEIEQYINIGISIILLFVLILAVVISSVLINGILSTSVEEKIREFGVLRVLGGHRSLPIRLTVYQAFILSGIGTAVGLAGGYATITYGILPLLGDLLSFSGGQIVSILSAETLAMTLGVGIGVSMVVGIMPALKVSRMSILGAINPYRQESVGTKMVKEESINLRYIITGIVMSGIAAFVLFIVPQIILTLDIGLIVSVLVILLSVFLFGATLVGLGFLPPIQNMIRRVFSIITHKTKEIIRISLLRIEKLRVI